MSIDRAALRRQIAEATIDDNVEAMTTLLDAAAEMARELKLRPEEFVHKALQAFAEAHGKEIKHFDVVKTEPLDDGTANGIEAIVAMSTRWGKN